MSTFLYVLISLRLYVDLLHSVVQQTKQKKKDYNVYIFDFQLHILI